MTLCLEPLELLEKLSALVPAPKAHLIRYSGILAPAAKWRSLIVPRPPPPPVAREVGSAHLQGAFIATALEPCSTAPAAALNSSPSSPPRSHGRNYTWAELMKRVWEIDVLE